MDRDLITRLVVSAAFIVAFLVASMAGFHVNIVGPLAVVGIAVAMFWPRHADEEPDAPAGGEDY